MIADQLGHSRVSMTQDVYMGRRTKCRPSSPTRSVALTTISGPSPGSWTDAERHVSCHVSCWPPRRNP